MRPLYNLPKTPTKTPTSRHPGPQGSSMDPVEVFCRILPVNGATPLPPLSVSDGMTEICVKALDDHMVQLIPPSNGFRCPGELVKAQVCRFTHVFDEMATQKTVYDRVAYDLICDLVKGKNGLLFTYGVTGSGKTYTMTGNRNEIGILPRTIDTLFNSIGKFQALAKVFKTDTTTNTFTVQSEAMAKIELQQESRRLKKARTPAGWNLAFDDQEFISLPRERDQSTVRSANEDNSFAVFVSYIQIYNKYIYDLLDPDQTPNMLPSSKLLREDLEHKMFVSGVIEVEVKTAEEALKVFRRGMSNRRMAETRLNIDSSRSHCVFTIRLLQAPLDATGRETLQDAKRIHVAQLSLVDLAGSERLDRTGHTGDRVREAGSINESLMVLRQCMQQLRTNQKTGSATLVPYRNSRLTHLFKNPFEGQGKVRMIVCINPTAANYEENKYVMEFAELTQEVQVQRAAGFHFPDAGDAIHLTPGRRRMAAMYDVQARFDRDLAVNAGGGHSMSPITRPPLPIIDWETVAPDDQIFDRLPDHFMYYGRRGEFAAKAAEKEAEFRTALHQMITENSALKLQYLEDANKLARCEEENRRLQSELDNARLRNVMLEAELAQCQRRVADAQGVVDQMQVREQQAIFRAHLKDEQLEAVKTIANYSSKNTIVMKTQDVTAKATPVSGWTATPVRSGLGTLRLATVPSKDPLRVPIFQPSSIRRIPSPESTVYSSRGRPIEIEHIAGTRTMKRVRPELCGRRRSKSVTSFHEPSDMRPASSMESLLEELENQPIKRGFDEGNIGKSGMAPSACSTPAFGILKKIKF